MSTHTRICQCIYACIHACPCQEIPIHAGAASQSVRHAAGHAARCHPRLSGVRLPEKEDLQLAHPLASFMQRNASHAAVKPGLHLFCGF